MAVKSRCDGPPDTSRGWALTRGWFYAGAETSVVFSPFLIHILIIKKNKLRNVATRIRRKDNWTERRTGTLILTCNVFNENGPFPNH
uniref:Putative salivary kunitz domain protein n=1 Tax=Ixodes ricinus TaxID=34613 RepID=A0A0K8RG11_IXORI